MEIGGRQVREVELVLVPATTNSAATGDVGLEYCHRSKSSFAGFVGSSLHCLKSSMGDSVLSFVEC